jgi:hypothetical protein
MGVGPIQKLGVIEQLMRGRLQGEAPELAQIGHPEEQFDDQCLRWLSCAAVAVGKEAVARDERDDVRGVAHAEEVDDHSTVGWDRAVELVLRAIDACLARHEAPARPIRVDHRAARPLHIKEMEVRWRPEPDEAVVELVRTSLLQLVSYALLLDQ